MPKDTALDELIAEAEDRRKQLAKFADAMPKMAARLEAGFKKDKPDLDWITQEIASDEKWLSDIESDLGKAEKTLKHLAKSKEAEAKKPAKELDAALNEVGKEIEKVRNTIGIAEKIADKAEVEDKRLAPVMKQALAIAAERRKALHSGLVNCPRVVQHLGDIVEKIQTGPMPIAMYENVMPVFARDMQKIGSDITSAESVASSLETLAKKGAKAFLPEVRQGVEDCTAAKKEIDTLVVQLRKQLADGIKSSNEWRASLGDKLKKAA